jgi:hypothetical protein
LTFPYNKDAPTGFAEFFEVSFVAEDVAEAFSLPEFSPCRGYNPAILTSVHMPETAVNKDYFFVFDQNDIRMAGQITAVKSVTITHTMNEGTHSYFRRGIPPKYARKMLAHEDLRMENVTSIMFEF